MVYGSMMYSVKPFPDLCEPHLIAILTNEAITTESRQYIHYTGIWFRRNSTTLWVSSSTISYLEGSGFDTDRRPAILTEVLAVFLNAPSQMLG